jgi:hypothetical protein
MKEIKEKYGFKKGGLVQSGKPKIAKKGWRYVKKNKKKRFICRKQL